MTTARKVYEKLGVFFLGNEFDLETEEVGDGLVLYDSKDLCTHAAIVGMTGSGKTGLGITLLEEAAIDQIPALIIDPKGDMANLLLNFPDLQGTDFRPWVNDDDAARADLSKEAYADSQAKLWRDGLAVWNQDGERIRRLRESAEFTVFTPGSDAGVPVSIVSSFAAPPAEIRGDADLMRDRISSTATSLLSLLGIDTDPVQSREHILLTIILNHCWQKGQDLDLGAIIRLVQDPPVRQVGVMELDAFFPAKERFALAMTLNNLLAAPGFAAWMQGAPLDVDSLLYTPAGKPKISIFSIAHLADSERHFFVSLLLNQTIGWMRTRPGTNSLRAILYIDEIFGYMPPVAEPPTKKPLLTLLKQARAFGVGVVLATQNPVDLDYKGLSNIGTWFLGRLQTERDKQRILDGLEGASNESGGSFDRASISDVLSRLGKRVFLMHNVHEDGPAVFHTRWALSYLSGPMTRDQIKRLRDRAAPVLPKKTERQQPRPPFEVAPRQPLLPPDVPQLFLPLRLPCQASLVYQPCVVAIAKIHFVDTRRKLSADEEVTLLCCMEQTATGIDWADAEELALDAADFEPHGEASGRFATVPEQATHPKKYTSWKKQLANHLYRTRRRTLWKSASFKEVSQPTESERDFRIRLNETAHEMRDAALTQLRKKYASKIRTLEDRIMRAEQKVDQERQEASGSQLQTAISWGATILSAVMSRKKLGAGTIGRATTAARGYGRSRKQAADVTRAEDRLQRYESQLQELETEIEQEQDLLREQFDPFLEELETMELKPRRTDIDIRTVALGWAPYEVQEDGTSKPLFR